ncbi:MAG TPA: NADPH:quinone oxidoreductase family protein [Microvirga sp.]|jgi:NADPH2:quinone reductase|nr:NADPH:quinone oxidoreductase family protein [Microvirga sp.]
MKALVCPAYGPLENLHVGELPDPTPGAGEVLIEVRAAGVNFPDVLIVQGKYQFKPEPPFAPGGEVAGVVRAVGPGVERFKAGDRVLATMISGGYAELAVAKERQVLRLPEGLGDEVASAFALTYGTSYHALKDRAALKPGETLLVLGAAGGVGLAAVELGAVMGARVIAAASSDDKLAMTQEHGAHETINYATEDLRARIKDLTGGKGVDVIYDPVGGGMAETALRSIAWEGRFLVVGFAAGEIPKLPLNLVLLKGCQMVGVFWGSFAEREPQRNEANLEEMVAWYREGRIRPHIDGTYPLEQSIDALRRIAARQVRGKLVITMPNAG